MFYSEASIHKIRKQFIVSIIIAAAILIGFLTVACLFLTFVPVLGYLFLVAGVSIVIFVLGMYTVPMFRYMNLIKEFLIGRSNELVGTVKSISPRPFYRDNKLYFYELLVEEDDIDRMILYDANLGEPEFQVGEAYKFRIHEVYMLDYSKVEY